MYLYKYYKIFYNLSTKQQIDVDAKYFCSSLK